MFDLANVTYIKKILYFFWNLKDYSFQNPNYTEIPAGQKVLIWVLFEFN